MSESSQKFPNLLVVIGASAGGLPAIKGLISELPEDFEAVLIVATHRDPDSQVNHLAEILQRNTRLRVRDPIQGEKLDCQTIYVGPPSKSLVLDGLDADLQHVEKDCLRIERIDALFETAARYAGPNAIGVILSGMLWDGVEGLKAISEAGGRCMVQEPTEAIFKDMPINAINAVEMDCVGSVKEIAERLTQIAADRCCQ